MGDSMGLADSGSLEGGRVCRSCLIASAKASVSMVPCCERDWSVGRCWRARSARAASSAEEADAAVRQEAENSVGAAAATTEGAPWLSTLASGVPEAPASGTVEVISRIKSCGLYCTTSSKSCSDCIEPRHILLCRLLMRHLYCVSF